MFKRMRLEDAKALIIDRLREGPATWRDFLDLGISKATLSRALRDLEEKGIISREGKYYSLKEDITHLRIKEKIAPQICILIGCQSPEELASDIMRELSTQELEELDKNITDLMSQAFEDSKASIGDILVLQLMKRILGYYGFTYVIAAEIGRILTGLTLLKEALKETASKELDSQSCEGTYREHLLSIIEKGLKETQQIGLSKDFPEKAAKLYEILEKHGYDHKIRISALGKTHIVDFKEVLYNYFSKSQYPTKVEVMKTLLSIADLLTETGYRPLGKKEVERLVKSIDKYCEELSTLQK